MKFIFSTTAVLILLTTTALAEEAPVLLPKVQEAADAAKEAEDCSKQVWPHFTPSCLRNAAQTTNVRLVSTERR